MALNPETQEQAWSSQISWSSSSSSDGKSSTDSSQKRPLPNSAEENVPGPAKRKCREPLSDKECIKYVSDAISKVLQYSCNTEFRSICFGKMPGLQENMSQPHSIPLTVSDGSTVVVTDDGDVSLEFELENPESPDEHVTAAE